MDSNSSILIKIYRFVTTIGDEFNVKDLSVIPTKRDGGAVIKWNHTMICLDKYHIVVEEDVDIPDLSSGSKKLSAFVNSPTLNSIVSVDLMALDGFFKLKTCQFFHMTIYPYNITENEVVRKFIYVNPNILKININKTAYLKWNHQFECLPKYEISIKDENSIISKVVTTVEAPHEENYEFSIDLLELYNFTECHMYSLIIHPIVTVSKMIDLQDIEKKFEYNCTTKFSNNEIIFPEMFYALCCGGLVILSALTGYFIYFEKEVKNKSV